MRSSRAALAAVLVAAAGCASPPAPPPPAEIPEASVKPGVNDSYRTIRGAADVQPWVQRFEVEGREIFDRRLEIVEAVGLKRGDVVADVGAGTGLMVPYFAAAVSSAGKVYAVDLVPEFLERVAARAAQDRLSQVQTVLCTEKSVALPFASIDVAFVCDTYHHFEYPQNTLQSIRHALRPRGLLVVVDFERVPGTSSDWVMSHVRAGKETVIAEIEAAGFELLEERPILEENYFLRFRRKG